MIKSIILLEENAKITFEKPISEHCRCGNVLVLGLHIPLFNLNHVFYNVHNKYKGR